jgi:ABC-2 type transport system permease protein
VILTAVFFGGDAISGEFQNKTGYYLIPNPVKRTSVYAGKWIAAFIASSIAVGVFVLAALGNFGYYFGAGVPVQFVESLIFAWVFLAAVLGSSFFFSSLFKSSSYSILVTAVLFLFGFNLIERLEETFAQSEPW